MISDLPLITYDPEREKFGFSDVKLGNKRVGAVRRRGHLWNVIEPAMPQRTGFTSHSAAGAALVLQYERQQLRAPR